MGGKRRRKRRAPSSSSTSSSRTSTSSVSSCTPVRRKKRRVQDEPVLAALRGGRASQRERDDTWIWRLEGAEVSCLAVLCEDRKQALFQEAADLCRHQFRVQSCGAEIHLDFSYWPEQAKHPGRIAGVKEALLRSPRKVEGWNLGEVNFVVASIRDWWGVGLGLNRVMMQRAAYVSLYLSHAMAAGDLEKSEDARLLRLSQEVTSAPSLPLDVRLALTALSPPAQKRSRKASKDCAGLRGGREQAAPSQREQLLDQSRTLSSDVGSHRW